jgi:hypothetical protein
VVAISTQITAAYLGIKNYHNLGFLDDIFSAENGLKL